MLRSYLVPINRAGWPFIAIFAVLAIALMLGGLWAVWTYKGPGPEGQGGEITVSRDLGNLLNLTDKEATKRGAQFIPSELFLLALTDDKGEAGRLLKQTGVDRKALEKAIAAPAIIGFASPNAASGIAATL